MTLLDRYLQQRRIGMAIPHVPAQARLLDVGCHHGELLWKLRRLIDSGTGIDPLCDNKKLSDNICLIKGYFPGAAPGDILYHCITALAIIEHIPASNQTEFLDACASKLLPKGKLIVSVPDASVDRILEILKRFRLIAGMRLEEHYGFNADETVPLAKKSGFTLILHKKFQLGLNNLFVFEKAHEG
ncbi:class I SAM-dependent methyltransferase [Flavihumibacter petaseus]|nr:methyltransferase domain-containing protein [Flavihumibacter petaseus]